MLMREPTVCILIITTSLHVVDRCVVSNTKRLTHCVRAFLAPGFPIRVIDLSVVPRKERDVYIQRIRAHGHGAVLPLPLVMVERHGVADNCVTHTAAQAMCDRGETLLPA